MFDRNAIFELYKNVLDREIVNNEVTPGQIKSAIKCMNRVYSPDTKDFDSAFPETADFNDVAFRCAYLHKYAPLHTYIVFDVMMKVLQRRTKLFRKLVNSGRFEMCCLGGGPGIDVIGVLAALYAKFGIFKSSGTIIDCMENWKYTFASIVYELTEGCDKEWNDFPENFDWLYVGANLLQGMTNEVNASIGSSSLVTMVKFLSAAACQRTEHMIEIIFRVMKPGALLLFIDNAGGGFTQLMMKYAQENGFVTLFGPLQHVRYSEEAFKFNRFGYNSCFSTTVTIILLQKPFNHQAKRKYTPLSQNNSIVNEKTPLLYSEKKMKKAPPHKYFPEGQVDRKCSTVLSPNSKDSRSKKDNSKPMLPNPLQFSIIFPRNNITALPEKENMKRNSRSPKSGNANNAQCEKTPMPTANQPVGPSELPILHVRLDKMFQKTEFKPDPCLSQRTCITNQTSITVQQISVQTNYYAADCFTPTVTPGYSDCSKTCSGEPEFLKFPTEENRWNTTFQGVNSRTPLFPEQTESKALHQNSFQRVKHLPNPSHKVMPVITNIRSETLSKSDVKVSALEKKTLYDSVTAQGTSVAGTNYNVLNCFETNATRNNIDCTETYSPNFNSTVPRKLPINESKLNTKFQGIDSRTPLFTAQSENQLRQDRSKSVITVPTHPFPLIDDDSTFKAFQEPGDKGSMLQKKWIPNYSSISTQPVSVAEVNYSADANRLSKPTKTQKNIDHSQVEEVCCPCCVTS